MVWNPDMLTDKKINQLTPKETQYKVADRDGLYLLVYPTGKKTFKFNYRYNNRQETLTIGSYGEITLAQARQELDRKSTRLNSSHTDISRMPSSA